MVEPTKTAPKKLTSTAKVEAKDPRSRTPTKGEKIEQGNAVAQTTGKGQGFGLSSGGGGTGGYLDVANFCCPDYLATMIDLINRNWNSKQGARGTTLLKFDIERDGAYHQRHRRTLERRAGPRLLLAAVAGAHAAVSSAARRDTRASG